MRNRLAKVCSRNKAFLAEKLKKIWLELDKASAAEYKEKYAGAMRFNHFVYIKEDKLV